MEKKLRTIIIAVFVIIMIIVSITIPLFLNFKSNIIILNTEKLGQIETGGEVRDVYVIDDMAYVVDTTDNNPGGLIIINVSDPTHPYKLGSYFQGGLPISVDVIGEIAYLANSLVGLEILNLSDLSHPIKIDQYTGSGSAFDVQVIGEIAYLADWSNGLVILNVSDPTDVREITSYGISGACVQVYVSENLVYLIDHYSEYSGLRIINVSDPFYPVQIGSYIPVGVDFWNPFVYGDYVYIGNHAPDGGELRIFDVSDPSQIIQIGLYDEESSVFATYVNGAFAYLADYKKGLVVVNISNHSNPTKIAQFFNGGHAVDIHVIDNIAYIADADDGLEIIKILL